MFWNRFPDQWESGFKLISTVFQQKARENRPSLIIPFLLIELKYQQEHCILVPCWAFLWRSMSRFLVGPSRARTGKRPAFLFLDAASNAGTQPPEVAMQPSTRPSTHLSLMISKPMLSFPKFTVIFFVFTCSFQLLAGSLLRMPQKLQKQVELYEKIQGTSASNGDTDFVFGLIIFAGYIITFLGFYFLLIRPIIRSCRGGTKKEQNK